MGTTKQDHKWRGEKMNQGGKRWWISVTQTQATQRMKIRLRETRECFCTCVELLYYRRIRHYSMASER